MNTLELIKPNWPAPANVKAMTTTRHYGYSQGPFASNNLDKRVDDRAQHVALNRQQLQSQAQLPCAPYWLDQVHGTYVLHLPPSSSSRQADAAITNQANTICAILTADCLPILLSDIDGQQVAAIHGGWRGLFHGIIEKTIAQMHVQPEHLIAWIGPGISQKYYEVDQMLRQAFMSKSAPMRFYFSEGNHGKWLADLAGIAEAILRDQGVMKIIQSGLCTYADGRFYSFRRDNGITGRMATLIYMSSY